MSLLNRIPRRESTAIPRSQTERLWLVGGGLSGFVLILIGYFFFISPQRSETTDVNGQVASVQAQNSALQARIVSLRQENTNLKKYQTDLAKARLALPTSTGVTDFVRTMQTVGNATLTNVTSVSIGQPTAVVPVAPVSPTGTATAGPASTAPPAPSAYCLSISATVSGSPTALDDFLEQLQSVQPRAILINQITETDNAGAGADARSQTSLQLTMNAFIAPGSGATSAATPGGTP